jgi:hypothetical protein
MEQEQMDVEETTQEEPTMERDSVIDAIAKRVSEKRSSTTEEPPEEVVPEVEEDEPADQEDAEQEDVELIVYGKKIYKTRAEVDAAGGVVAMQTKLAADQRFREAAAEKAEALRLREELAAMQQEPQEDTLTPRVDAIVENIYSGDEDALKKALADVLTKQQGPVVDESEIVKKTLFAVSRDEGMREFNRSYSHLSEDAYLRSMVNEETKKIMADNPNLSPRDVIIAAAESVDNWVNGLNGGDRQAVSDKANIDTFKPATARVKRETGYKPKTKEEIFAELKSSRAR